MLLFFLKQLMNFFFIVFAFQLLSNWSQIKNVYDKCDVNKDNEECQQIAQTLLFYVFTSAVSAFNSVVETTNFLLFIVRQTFIMIKNRTYE